MTDTATLEGAMYAAAAGIGHNKPPEPTPLEAFRVHIDDLFETAAGFLDGDPIGNEATAELVSKLLDEARTAEKDGNAARVLETKPLDEAKAAIMDAWRPLVDPKTGRCKLIADTCKQALAPWLQKKDDEQRAIALAAQKVTDELAAAALAAHVAADTTDLAAVEKAETAIQLADDAAKAAAKADKARPTAAGGRRAVTLVSVWSATVLDPDEAGDFCIKTFPAEFMAWVQGFADHQALHGPRTMPGVAFNEAKVAR